jgi:cytoskeletal protein RodZ
MNPDNPVTPDKAERPRRGVLLPVGLALLFVLGAAGFFYAKRDAGPETSPAPGSQQAARPADKSATSPPAEPPAPSASVQQSEAPARSASPSETPSAAPVAPAPRTSASSSPQPTNQSPAAQAQRPAESAPAASTAPPAPPAMMSDQPTSLPSEITFVQKPGVNIRSEPNVAGRIVGSASKGRQFKVIGRAGNWVHVEDDTTTGWIGGRLLGPQKP